MRNIIKMLITMMVISVGFLSGCNEETGNNQFTFTIENYASYQIVAEILFQGEGFTYDEQISIESLKTNSASFPIEPKDQSISFRIKVYYNDSEYYTINDVESGNWTIGGSGDFKFIVFGTLNPPENKNTIWIQGPVG